MAKREQRLWWGLKMNLEYKILWFEDDVEIIDDYSNDIKMYLEELGFTLTIIHQENGKNLDELVKRDFDLILTDLNLGEYETGDRLIQKIRGNDILTEVLFYSGNEEEIIEILERNKWVERVSVSVGIEYLVTKIKDLVYLTVKKFQDVNNIRGLVMAETSELDNKMENVIVEIFSAFSEDEFIFQKNTMFKKLIENREGRIKTLRKLEDEELKSFFKWLESYDKVRTIQRLLKGNSTDLLDFNENRIILNRYKEEVIDKRNALAHAKVVVNDTGEKIVTSEINGETISFDDNSCTIIRKNIRKHNENFNSILEKLNGKVEV